MGIETLASIFALVTILCIVENILRTIKKEKND